MSVCQMSFKHCLVTLLPFKAQMLKNKTIYLLFPRVIVFMSEQTG